MLLSLIRLHAYVLLVPSLARSGKVVRRSDKHNSILCVKCPGEAAEDQQNSQQKGKTQECYKNTYHYGLQDHYSIHTILPLLLASRCSSVTSAPTLLTPLRLSAFQSTGEALRDRYRKRYEVFI